MGIVDWILGRPANPTLDWPEYRRRPPVVDVTRGIFNDVPFCQPLDVASQLGRPDVFRWLRRRECELLYRQGGFVVEFVEGLDIVGLLIAPDEFLPEGIGNVEYCRPVLRSAGTGDFVGTPEKNRAAIVAHFGEPASVDADTDETILTYEWNRYHLEFELTPADTLKRINVSAC